IIGSAGVFDRADKDSILSAVEAIAKLGNVVRPDWNGLSFLLLDAAETAAHDDLSLVQESENSIESAKCLYLMGADDASLDKLPGDAFVVYQGQWDTMVTLPAVPTVGDARDDWKIIRALSEMTGTRLPCDSVGALRARIKTVANLLHIDEIEGAGHCLSFIET
ncbi:hypothetical protein IFM89_020848, partial [Coptis chinensis]